jgi:hypothetical protein
VYYKASAKLKKIIEDFSEFIKSTVKLPLKAYPVPQEAHLIIKESSPVSILLHNVAISLYIFKKKIETLKGNRE